MKTWDQSCRKYILLTSLIKVIDNVKSVKDYLYLL